MKAPSPYYSYDQISVMAILQRRRIYNHDKKVISTVTTIPMIVFATAAVIYGLLGWSATCATIRSGVYCDLGVVGFIDFLAFGIAAALLTVMGESNKPVPLGFLVFMLVDTAVNASFSVVLVAMFLYLLFAAVKVARHEANLNLLKQFKDYPFLVTSDDIKLRTYRDQVNINELEILAERSIRDRPVEPSKPREEYTTRRW